LPKTGDAHADTVTLFEECASGKFEPYTSAYAVEELEDAQGERRELKAQFRKDCKQMRSI